MDGFGKLKNTFEEAVSSNRFSWECSCHSWRRAGIHPGRMKKLGRIGSDGNAVVIAGEDQESIGIVLPLAKCGVEFRGNDANVFSCASIQKKCLT